MRTFAFGKTDIGRRRETNEDAMLVDCGLGLYVVCDGIGGNAAGEVAADLAARTIRKAVADALAASEDLKRGAASHDTLRETVARAVNEACREVHDAAGRSFEYTGMGCTVTMLLVSDSKAAMAHVGDTSLFLCRDEQTERLNIPHTYAAELVRLGVMTRGNAQRSWHAHTLSRAVGTHEAVDSDKLILDIVPGDTFLLCSDGLTWYLEGENELTSYLTGDDLGEVPEQLVELANSRGGHDNITVVVVRAEATDEEQEEAQSPDKDVRAKLGALAAADLFRDLSLANRARLLNISETRGYEPGDTVFREGDPWNALSIVLDGSFSLVGIGKRPRSLKAGECVGESTLLHSGRCRASLRAQDRGHLLVIPGDRFHNLARRRPWLGVKLLSRLAESLGRELERAGMGGS